MKIHISLARVLIRLGSFLKSSAIMVMSSDDLVEFSRQSYDEPKSVLYWNNAETMNRGFDPAEQKLLDHIPVRTGNMLLLGVGGGREAIQFAQMGFNVTGVDFIPAMVENAIQNVERSQQKMQGLVQEISDLDVPDNEFDVSWLSASMYSCLPTRFRRVKLLHRVRRALKPGGFFGLQFQKGPLQEFSPRTAILHKIIAMLTLGNLTYEPGDMLWGNNEFVHAFSSETELISEFSEAGFQVVWLNFPEMNIRGEALLMKKDDIQSNFELETSH
ncbi:class I SAM-dependent methyltransferase [Chloroflexota bacterium]